MKFEIGDRVYYVSGDHGKGPSNPLKGSSYECPGTVREANSYNLFVKWDNNTANTYNHEDLEPADMLDKLNPNHKFRMEKRNLKRR